MELSDDQESIFWVRSFFLPPPSDTENGRADGSLGNNRNWLRDYSQAMDTATLSKAQPETIRILVWILSFMSFGYATAEFEVTPERLGVYRPEEHIDKFVSLSSSLLPHFPNTHPHSRSLGAVPRTTTMTKMPVRFILN